MIEGLAMRSMNRCIQKGGMRLTLACVAGVVMLGPMVGLSQQGAAAGTEKQTAAPDAVHQRGTERTRQITEESAQLLALARDLRMEADKTSKGILSMKVVHDADEIQKLANDLKKRLKAGHE